MLYILLLTLAAFGGWYKYYVTRKELQDMTELYWRTVAKSRETKKNLDKTIVDLKSFNTCLATMPSVPSHST